MKTFYQVFLTVLIMGLAVLSFFAPWTSTPVTAAGPRNSLGYAAIWSQQFAAVSGARVDYGGFGILAFVVVFFAAVIAGSAYFFRNKRGADREDA